MKPVTKAEKDRLIQELLRKVCFSGAGRSGGIGHHTMKLKGRKRKIMESLTAEDFQHRIK